MDWFTRLIGIGMLFGIPGFLIVGSIVTQEWDTLFWAILLLLAVLVPIIRARTSDPRAEKSELNKLAAYTTLEQNALFKGDWTEYNRLEKEEAEWREGMEWSDGYYIPK